MFKKLSQIQTYKQYTNYLEKLTKIRDEYKEAYEKEANNFYINLKVVLNPTRIFNSSTKNCNVHASTKPVWDSYNKDNKNYIAYSKYKTYIDKLTGFVNPIIDKNLTQTNKYWLNLFIKILNEKTGKKWRAVNISARVSEPYAREESTKSENYICLINEDTDLNSISLKSLETQYNLYNLNILKRNYEMNNLVLLSEHKDLTDLIVYDNSTLNNNFIKYPRTYNLVVENNAVLHKIPSNRKYKLLETGVYNELWKKVLEKANEFEISLTQNNEEQSEELE